VNKGEHIPQYRDFALDVYKKKEGEKCVGQIREKRDGGKYLELSYMI